MERTVLGDFPKGLRDGGYKALLPRIDRMGFVRRGGGEMDKHVAVLRPHLAGLSGTK